MRRRVLCADNRRSTEIIALHRAWWPGHVLCVLVYGLRFRVLFARLILSDGDDDMPNC